MLIPQTWGSKMARKIYVTLTVDAILWVDDAADVVEELEQLEPHLEVPDTITVEDCSLFGWEIEDVK